jgi:hypothetical protein
MDVGAALVANGQPPIAIEPSQCALDLPAMAAQALAGVDVLAGDAAPNVELAQGAATARDVIGLVGVRFVRATEAAPVQIIARVRAAAPSGGDLPRRIVSGERKAEKRRIVSLSAPTSGARTASSRRAAAAAPGTPWS